MKTVAVLANSISILEEIELGGIKQSVDCIRGNNKDNPILLFLHGGPGYSQIAYARKYQRELEKDFTSLTGIKPAPESLIIGICLLRI